MSKFTFKPTPEPLTLLQGGLASKGPGRPRKAADAIAQEKVADISKLRDLGVDFSKNLMTNQIEFVGSGGSIQVIEGDRLSWLGSDLAMRFGQSLPDARLKPAVQFLANENAYDPHIQFLERWAEEHEPSEGIHSIATDYLGNTSPIANAAMMRMMVGAVARAYQPGCSMSWLPILISAQGRGKSMFAKSLVPTDLFAEMNSDLHKLVKESYRLHAGWILELPEIDQFFKPSQAEVLKNLITLQVDEVRRPYELPSKAKRGFIFIGTSNEHQLLVDSTGNRRFVPIRIPDTHEIPWRQLREERGGLWAAAIKLYREGEQWEYNTGQLAEISVYQDDFLERDPWHGKIETYVANKQYPITADILENAIEISVSNIHNGHQRRCGRVMRALGFENCTRKMNGKSQRCWARTAKATEQQTYESDF